LSNALLQAVTKRAGAKLAANAWKLLEAVVWEREMMILSHAANLGAAAAVA